MLSAQAKSFRHKSRLAISLSWIAGFVNVTLLIACGQTVSHQTGNTTRFGNALANLILQKPAAMSELVLFAVLIGLFLAGSFLSGLLIEIGQHNATRSRFLLPMILEAALLSMLEMLLRRHPSLSVDAQADRPMLMLLIGMASLAMGLQNATITHISGSVVRTTHLTGVITDLGLELVQLWHNKPARPAAGRRVILLSCIFGSFLLGVTIGTVLFEKFGPTALLLPVIFLTALIVRSFSKTKGHFGPV